MDLRQEILSKYAPAPRPVEALNGSGVYARSLSAADMLDLNVATTNGERLVLVVLRGTCDAEGRRVFREGDADLVRSLPAEFCDPVSKVVLELSGFSAEEGSEGKAGSAPSGSSPSG